MTNLNNNLPKIETVAELKENNYEFKTSSLSKVAQTKIIKMYGGNYVSEQAFTADIGWPRGYGPCVNCENNLGLGFELEIVLKNYRGGWKKAISLNVSLAREVASEISRNVGFWSDDDGNKFSRKERSSLVDKINRAIDEHINYNKKINRVVESDKDDGNSGDCSVIM